MTLEERLSLLEHRVAQLEKPLSLQPSSNWTTEEIEYLQNETRGIKPLRPKLLELQEKWQKVFQRTRSYDSLYSKVTRLRRQ